MIGEELATFAEKIKSKEDFMEFMKYYLEDYDANRDEWENSDLESYLTGMCSFVVAMESYYKNNGEKVADISPWRLFSEILLAACVYEG